MPTVIGDHKPRDLLEIKWVNIVLRSLITTLAGAFHALQYRKYGEQYLATYANRFNRRVNLYRLIARLIVDMARTKSTSEKDLGCHAEAHFKSDPDLN